ncbi:F-box/LRR-repeat protein 4-like isoform X1 [Temnothorax americanus]|uniref:F-box/LRR-repeat protein 4-like isoform X1 n=1 Tax=Temnothorax americanus TaxID=1964332 RepID=UPI0040676BF8
MTSHYRSLSYESDSRYPYVERAVAGEDHVDFVYQFIKDTYIDECNFNHYNYIDFEFHEAVYPIRVSIYDVYNFGYVTQILAQDPENRWFLLWAGQPWIVPSTSQLLSPLLRSYNFKTKILRLKFMYKLWSFNTLRDAVMLIGTSKLILPKNPKQSLTTLLKSIKCKYTCHWNIYNLTSDYKNAHLDIFDLQKNFTKYCIIYKSDIATSFDKNNLSCKKVFQKENVPSSKQRYMNRHLLRDHSNYKKVYKKKKFMKDIKLSLDKSKEQPFCSFSTLSDEIILKILQNLDIKSLYYVSRVNKRLNHLTQDSFLFTHLNLRNMRFTDCFFIYNIIVFFARCESRRKYLQQLDLTSSNISVLHFVKFLNICDRRLTHLRLSSCRFVNDFALFKISKICKNLKILDLSHCYQNDITAKGFSYLENLEFLEDLDLSWTKITTKPLCKILQKNRRMRNLHLNGVISSSAPLYVEAVVIQLRNSCPDLEIIDLTGGVATSRSIDALTECKSLRKLNIGVMCDDHRYPIDKHSVHRLFSSCQSLEEVNSICRTEWGY